jgi:RimJ/RimL family protein N-acetyltransferase
MTAFDLEAFTPPLQVPRLASSPVILRPFEQADLALVRQASSDPLIPSISSVPSAYTDEAGRAFITRQHARATGLGSIGLWLRDVESGRASVGYWLVAGARGHGLAAAALRGVVAFAFSTLAIPRLHLFVEPWNLASARTARAAGFSHEGTLRGWERIDGEQHDCECFAFLHAEWAFRS